MTGDVIDDARGIAGTLRATGHVAAAEALADALAGSTGTEILMGLRFHLQNLQRATTPYDAELSEEIGRVLGEVRQALGDG